MNNHFNHISATEKLKAKTLKKAKSINWGAISSIAAILVVMIGVSAFIAPHIINAQKNSSMPENNLYSSIYENSVNDEIFSDKTNSENFIKGEAYDTDDSGENISSSFPNTAGDIVAQPPLITNTPTSTAPPVKEPSATSTPTITKPIVTDIPIPVTTPSPTETPKPTTTPYISDGGLSAQVTERPANYDELIAANRETMYITADNVAAHDRASTDAPIKFTIPKGAQVIADRNFKRIWAYVHYEEDGIKKYGFVLEEYLSTEKP